MTNQIRNNKMVQVETLLNQIVAEELSRNDSPEVASEKALFIRDLCNTTICATMYTTLALTNYGKNPPGTVVVSMLQNIRTKLVLRIGVDMATDIYQEVEASMAYVEPSPPASVNIVTFLRMASPTVLEPFLEHNPWYPTMVLISILSTTGAK